MNDREMYGRKLGMLDDCLALIKSGDILAPSGVVTEPTDFLGNIHTIAPRLENVTIVKSKDHHYPFLGDPAMKGHICTVSHLFADNLRNAHSIGLADYIPSDLSQFSRVRTSVSPNNVFIAQATDMDENGNFQVPYCRMFEDAMYECAKTVILEVNPRFKRVRGGIDIPVTRVTKFFISDKPLFTIPKETPTETDEKIGAYIADLIHDGDTIQLGIGRLPDAVAVKLAKKNDLGLHSEMFTSNMVELIRKGVITGRNKTVDKGEHVGAFALGDTSLYETLYDNPACRIESAAYTNDPHIIGKQDNMKSVNTCMEMDLLGQVCSESIGPKQYSGAGGAADFARGAFQSKGGRGIIAFTSTVKGGTMSKIKTFLTPGASVTIPRNIVDTVITEYGIAELKGRTVSERAAALISIAHPNFRGELMSSAKELGIII